jgi:large subunit ribosomal protein LP2
MKHLAAYLLLGLGGNTSPSASDIKEVLESVGIEADDERLDKLISELEGKDINEVCNSTSDLDLDHAILTQGLFLVDR